MAGPRTSGGGRFGRVQRDLHGRRGRGPTIGPVRWTATGLAAVALVGLWAAAPAAAARPVPLRTVDRGVVLVLDHGTVERHVDRLGPEYALPDLGRPAAAAVARAAKAPRRAPATFATALDRLLAGKLIDQPTRDRDRAALVDARRSFGRLRGTRRDELGAVLANLDGIAAAGMLSPSRLPGLVLTLERNRQWWTSGPLLGDGQRVGFAGSELVWQYYAGQGLEIQWLGTFGKANGYFLSGRADDARLTALLDQAIGLATQRGGGIAWEYDFHFDGGAPPWVSAIAEGTAVQSIARAAVRFGRADYFNAAHAALGIFATPPPEGVRVATPAGAHYLIYSYAPGERVLNSFIQSLVALHDYAGLANSDEGRALFAAGQAEAQLEVPRYDTGAWSMYDLASESDLSYHTLLRDFLGRLCDRLQAPAAAPTPPAGPAAPAAGPTGGTAPTPIAAPPIPYQVPAPSAAVYCLTAAHFSAYLRQPPVVALAGLGGARAGRPARMRLSLSKISQVTVTASRAGRTAFHLAEEVAHGTRTLAWTPSLPGSYQLRVAATDLAGNAATAAAVVAVGPAPGRR